MVLVGLYSGRKIKATKGKLTRTQTGNQALKAIVKKYGKIVDSAKYKHVGKGNWVRYSIENDRKKTGKVTTDLRKWTEQPHKLDYEGKDTKGSGKSKGKEKSKGHLIFVGDFEIYKRGNDIYVSNVQNYIDVYGNRSDSRFLATKAFWDVKKNRDFLIDGFKKKSGKRFAISSLKSPAKPKRRTARTQKMERKPVLKYIWKSTFYPKKSNYPDASEAKAIQAMNGGEIEKAKKYFLSAYNFAVGGLKSKIPITDKMFIVAFKKLQKMHEQAMLKGAKKAYSEKDYFTSRWLHKNACHTMGIMNENRIEELYKKRIIGIKNKQDATKIKTVPKIKIEYVKRGGRSDSPTSRKYFTDPLIAFKNLIKSRSVVKDSLYIDVENEAGSNFTIRDIYGIDFINEPTIAYNKFLQKTFLANHFEVLSPLRYNILTMKKAPLRQSRLSIQYA